MLPFCNFHVTFSSAAPCHSIVFDVNALRTLQHIIYLLCRSQALLIPSLGELQVLCSLIGNVYLKSTHSFIRIATLQGLLCLLECCSKTNTTMGRLSEELALLRALIVGYINRHGIIDER